MGESAAQRRVRRAGIGLGAFVLLALLGAAALRWHGLRATATPSRLEARTARAIRDFAIPGDERHKTNPDAGDAAALEQGREMFLARCATCHGVDGRGSGAVGAYLYPRAPDLHSAPTQALSDGELHYIVEYGVPLTGMPAMPGPADAAAAQSWKVVAYLRSFGGTSPTAVAAAAIVPAHYTGSAACQPCHAAIYEHWKKTPMANVVRDPRAHPEAVLPDLRTVPGGAFTEAEVALVYGSIWKQRYFTKVGDNYYPLPLQWDVAHRKWLPYHVPNTGADWWAEHYPPGNRQRPTGPTCDGCHSVNYNLQTHQVTEWNVGCERCHGPGSEHVAHPTAANIVNPDRLDTAANTDTCVQCHSQGRPLASPIQGMYYDWPVGYRVGRQLQDYWTLEDHTLGQTTFTHFADGTARKNRMQGNDFVQSVMYRRGITCATCHDVHGTANPAQLRAPAQQLCLECHGPGSPNGPHTVSLEAHTHHAAGSAGSECIACHMPRIATQGVPGAFVRSHTFRFIPPAMTGKYKIPNPCTTCHADKSTSWATQQLLSWQTASPWRMEQ
ncbi:MAG TPA: cytochrome c3 family protein [Terriglobales bacterium]|nr:cytochrome c3 family protein [Terriglobales bacterium]